MPAWASIERDATWLARLQASVVRPAVFVFLDWPTEEVRASTFHRSITIGADTWTGVGDAARIDGPEFRRSGALLRYRVGLASVAIDEHTEAELDLESEAIGRRAILYLGLFDAAWENPVLESVFIGHILTVGDFKIRNEDGDKVMDASIEISNGRNPRRTVALHHGNATAEAGDTSMRLLPTVARALKWPA